MYHGVLELSILLDIIAIKAKSLCQLCFGYNMSRFWYVSEEKAW